MTQTACAPSSEQRRTEDQAERDGARMPPIRVLIVDDHRSFAEAIALWLSAEPDIVLVGTIVSLTDADATIRALRPDVLVLDVEVRRENSLPLASCLRTELPGMATVVVTFRDDVETASAAVRAGVLGFVVKDAEPSDLLHAIRAAARGEAWIQPRLLAPVLGELTRHPGTLTPDQQKLARLSEREQDVLAYMVRGYDRASIASELYLSSNTVRTHTRNLLAKLDVHSSLEAVALALRAGLRPTAEETSPR
jgi:DNA-binding NarL/FixJ family response regulator